MNIKDFPKKLNRHEMFRSPIWVKQVPHLVKELNKISDPYIAASKKNMKKSVDERNKKWGNKKDSGFVFHSTTLTQEPKLTLFHQYITETSFNLLTEMGYNLKNFNVTLTESWVQEFAKNGGGHHTLHTHWNGHISGFYFLKASERTSKPIFQDPRPGHLMNGLPLQNQNEITYGSTEVHYSVRPGTMIFFPSYMPHMYAVDSGYEPFRFIHWNVQALPVLDKVLLS